MQSDNILFWNDVALEANRISFTNGKMEQPGPTLSSRALAIIHLAMYDAYASIDHTAGAVYFPGLPAVPAGATTDAAVAGAAYATLSSLYPSQKDYFATKLSEAGIASNAGFYFGTQVAKAILDDRKSDPTANSDGYTPLGEHGKHKEDPDNPGQGFHAAFYGAKSKGFAITQRFELQAPPFQNPEYMYSLNQVRGKGIAPELIGNLPAGIAPRDVNETLTGTFWSYDGSRGLGTPPRFYNQIVKKIAIAKGNTEAQNARLFVLVNTAMADAGILAWDQKYKHNFWRPVVGIREHDVSMGNFTHPNNPISTDCDPTWLPLGAPASNALNTKLDIIAQAAGTLTTPAPIKEVAKNFTPNFPAYPSGHATFGGAALHMTRLFFGNSPGGINKGGVALGDRNPDTLCNGLYFISDECNGATQDNKGAVRPNHARSFPNGLWEMIKENGYSRVFLGVHWSFDAFSLGTTGHIDLNAGVDAAHVGIGGVPLGVKIAEDIFSNGLTKSTVAPR